MSNDTLIKEFKTADNLTVSIYVREWYTGSDAISDQFELTDTHQGGITIKNPEYDGHMSYKYAIPMQCSLAELTKHYAKQGCDNPSRAAYASLQRELGWYITADDISLLYIVSKNGIELANNFGISSEFSWQYSDQSLEQFALELLTDYDDTSEALEQARNTLTELVA